ncbi:MULTISPECIES: GNAT family N-acetyltransferase [Pseudolactococcus]|uniref:N-Acyltransferase superfamily protein n=1 Tax=Pseudolactococcus piscium MKFS47 TaxID=297352 RepID=A0A0D6DUL9_9LACT|nr:MULTISPECIES: GNAT family N-acetyltransferase [Lactococcus]MCJ1969250.1 GNAT family N-acetyltransferase [Lactococcus carnosus]MCJ1973349.1 GNAT family N-acetyltransferase [Lactococcus carnosus]MCJ1975910.1 GNAT family N-acetyltransferase [Lactococcus carnosus]MCJ1986155.1 GNAT family N-acetyltransferase [Lactococcus carnosus]CEN27659.1 N-Acyltransferase superfamily protein [Lactococcus piscium MKFS47]
MITYEKTDTHVDYAEVTKIMHDVELTTMEVTQIERSFKNSQVLAFAFEEGKLVACGRALSDRVSQANIYNIAVEKRLQGKGIGRKIIQTLLDQLVGQIVTLYTHPQTHNYYKKIGFSNLNTGFIKLPSHEKTWYIEEGFIDQ